MLPLRVPATNAVLAMEGEGTKHDLPVERVIFNPGTDKESPGFESVWMPDLGERKAIANGAQIGLRLWGKGHPPVNIVVGEPDEDLAQRLFTMVEMQEASAIFYDALSARFSADEDQRKMKYPDPSYEPLKAAEIPAMFEEAVNEAIRRKRPQPAEGRQNGDGKS